MTTHDEFAISWTREDAISKVDRLLATETEAEARQLFRLCSQSQWSYERAKRELADGAWRSKATPILYRPFDTRWTIWDSNVAVHRRERVFDHLRAHENYALLLSRVVEAGDWAHAFVGTGVAGHHCVSIKEVNYALPLWIYPKQGSLLNNDSDERSSNLAADFSKALSNTIGGLTSSPEDVFGYIYAVLYSPKFRARYVDFLRRDFPRIPLPANFGVFQHLAGLGQELIELHLLRRLPSVITGYPKAGSNRVDKIEFRADKDKPGQGRVQINTEQYFEGMPRYIWEYKIGGYQVSYQWLKDRKGRLLTFDELQHYGRVVAALNDTVRLQTEIDTMIA